MSFTFKSKHFGTKPNSKLVAAADDHAFHVTPGEAGDHVSLIQGALFILVPEFEKLPGVDKELGSSTYGSATSEGVRRFKKARGILNFQNQIDPIVGINTMRALDKAMDDREKGLKPAPKGQDVVIHILGQDPTNKTFAGKKTDAGQTFVGVPSTADFRKEVETAEYLNTHDPVVLQQWNGGLPQFGTDPTDEIVEFIKSSTSVGADKLGKVILIGMSSGGRNVATVAAKFADRTLFTYVSAIDAAFNDSADPAMQSKVNAIRSENFFQSLGNGVIPGDEFHGKIPSFQKNEDFADQNLLTPIAAQLKGAFTAGMKRAAVDAAHTFAVRRGYDLAKGTALKLLKG